MTRMLEESQFLLRAMSEGATDGIFVKDVEGRYRMVNVDYGGKPAIQGILRDVTKRKRAEETLRLTQFALEHAGDAAMWLDRHGHVVYANAASCELLGYSRDKLLSLSVSDYDPDVSRDDFVRAFERPDPTTFEARHRTKAGKYVAVEVSTYGVRFGDVEIMCSYSRDITERKQAEEVLRRSEERYRRLVEISPHGIQEVDLNGTFTFSNPAHHKILGCSQGEVLGMALWDFVESEPEKAELQRYVAYLVKEQPPPTPYVARIKAKDGRDVDMEVAWNYKRDETGRLEGFVAVVTDVTERKRAQAQLVQAAKLATLGEMATGMAHELNQPLNVIRMVADSMRERVTDGDIDPTYVCEKLARISKQTERAAGIIEHMRIFGRKAEEQPEEIDPREAVKQAVDLMSEQFRLRNIEVEAVLPERCRKVLGHAVQLEQVVLNLLTNARDAIEANDRASEGPRNIRVIVEDMFAPDGIKIIVRDTGGGIPEDALPRVFEPFYTTKRSGRGTGLGLSISYGIVTEMGGTIAAANVDGGAQFTITLDAVKDDA